MKCPRCQHENPLGQKFCGECGACLAAACPSCGASNPPGQKFCGECGASLAQPAPAGKFASPESYIPTYLAEKILTSKAALEGERKQVTVLFADLKGSMELLADRDPEDARKILDPVLERMMEAVHRYEGTVNQVMGDGIMALFGAPVAHEDHALRGCYAALRMQRRVNLYADEIQREGGTPVQIRVGLNSGEVVVRSIGSDLHMDYTAVGQTTHLAARMEQMAKPGSVLVTGETLKLAEGYFQVRPLGPITVKGLESAMAVYELIGIGPARSRLQASAARGLTRFVGRERELEQLTQALERTAAGHGQTVAVVGEAGVGKSRLLWEFTRSHRTHGWLLLESGSVSYGKATPYLPVVELLKAYFRIQDRDDQREIRERVAGKLLMLDRGLEPLLTPLLTLLDVPVADAAWDALDPPQRRQRTLEAVKRLLLRESQVQPLLLIFEDLHWIDSETQSLLDGLIESLPTARVLLLVNYRPEYQHTWGHKTYYLQLRIDPLPAESAEELLSALLGEDQTLEPLKRLLIERTEGNPFFLEESVRTLVETKILVGERSVYRMVKPPEQWQIPATTQAILAARIDRLPPEDKRLLQAAAVIGKDVPFALLQTIADVSEDSLRQELTRLQGAEFLYETSLFPDLEYTFKHALTHEVAYGSVLQERRRTLHARLVEAIEALYPERLTEQAERLAHHASRGELWAKAVIYLEQAGTKAMARSAYHEAIGLFEEALVALNHLPESPEGLTRALEIRIALGTGLMAVRGATAPEVEAAFASAQDLCNRLGDTSQLFPVLWGLWYVNYSRGQYRQARDLAVQLLEVAQTREEPAQLLEAHHSLWATMFSRGELASARTHLHEGLALYDLEQHRSHAALYGHDPGVCGRVHQAATLWLLGYPDQALVPVREALRRARELSHPFTTVVALYYAAWLYYNLGDRPAATESVDAMLALAKTHGFPLWSEIGSILTAGLLVEQGRLGEGTTRLEQGLASATKARRWSWREVFGLCLLADAYGQAAQPERGLQALAQMTKEAESGGLYESELFRIKGELLLRQGEGGVEEAQQCFRRAIEIARLRQAKSLELRASTNLARLLGQGGRRDEAREVLRDTYHSFTEGLKTTDLMNAKAVLDDLSRA